MSDEDSAERTLALASEIASGKRRTSTSQFPSRSTVSGGGKRLLVLGERGVPGADTAHFDRPTDVAVLNDGSFYVADGYRNTRVMKFAVDGRFLFTVGHAREGPGQFDTPHSIAVDATGRVDVADRGNARVQVFTPDGQFLAQWKSEALGRPYGLALGPDGRWFVADGGDQPVNPPNRSALVVATATGEVLERIGRWGNYDGQFALVHDLAVSRDGSVYVGDIRGMRVQQSCLAHRRAVDEVGLRHGVQLGQGSAPRPCVAGPAALPLPEPRGPEGAGRRPRRARVRAEVALLAQIDAAPGR